METFSLLHWIIVLVIVVLPLWFAWRTVAKSGHSGWWALLLLVPLVNLIMLWVFAFAQWPSYPDR